MIGSLSLHHYLVSICCIVCNLVLISSPAFSLQVSKQEISDFEQECFILHTIEGSIHGKSDASLREEALRDKEKIPIAQHGRAGDDVFQFYKARLFLLAASTDEAYPSLPSLATKQAVAPESLWAIEGSKIRTPKDRIEYEKLLGTVLPVSAFGQLFDNVNYTRAFDERIPTIPLIYLNDHLRIADLYYEMAMFKEARDLYVEAIYASMPPPSNMQPVGEYESWLSPKASPIWLKAAKASWYSGDTMTMYDYLAKAIIYSNNESESDILHFINAIKEDKLSRPNQQEPSQILIREIASLYAKMNLHPRAIALLQQYHQLLGKDGESDEKKYLDQWNVLLDKYCTGVMGDKCILFGLNVLPKENRAHIIIPYPCSDDALKQVIEALHNHKF